MKIFIICLFLLFAEFQSFASIQIVVIGDSITTSLNVEQDETYYYLLNKNLKSFYDVKIIHCGVGGMFSGGGGCILDCLYQGFDSDTFHPTVSVLAIGFNDFFWGLPSKDTHKAIESFVLLSLKHGCIPIIGKMDFSYWYPSFSLERIAEFNKIFDDLVSKYHIQTFSFLTPDLVKDPSTHIGDRIHLTAKGHKIISNNLEEVIISILQTMESKAKGESLDNGNSSDS